MKIQIGEMQIKNIDYRKLKPLQGNLKDLSTKNYSKLKKSFSEKGLFVPMFVWQEGDVYWLLDGHGRERLFSKEKAVFVDSKGKDTFEIPALIIQAKDLKDAKEKILLISSQFQNITQEGFDEFTFDLDQSWLDESINFDAFNFLDDQNISKIEEVEGQDDAPEAPENPKTKIGDIYVLGDHLLMCGDSTKLDEVKKLCDLSIDLFLTDPPYNVAYEGKTEDALTIQNDSMSDEDFLEFLTSAFKCADAVMRKGACFYIWHASSEAFNFMYSCHSVGWKVRQCIIWLKNTIVMGRQDYHWKHEPCLYGWKDGAAHTWANDRKQSTVLEFNKPTRNDIHPTMKPVDLFEYQIVNNTKKGNVVLDLFGGSGTTLIACEKQERVSRIMELDQKYCDVIVERWEKFTGKKAELKRG
jgi:DNA modification methylase